MYAHGRASAATSTHCAVRSSTRGQQQAALRPRSAPKRAPERHHQVQLLGQRGAHDAAAHRLAKQHKRKLAAGGQQQAAARGGAGGRAGGGRGISERRGRPACKPGRVAHAHAPRCAHRAALPCRPPPARRAAPAHGLDEGEAKGLAHRRHDRHLARDQHRHGRHNGPELGEEERHADLHAHCGGDRRGARGGGMGWAAHMAPPFHSLHGSRPPRPRARRLAGRQADCTTPPGTAAPRRAHPS